MRIENTVYLDHQATTPTDERVLAKMLPFHRFIFGNPHSSEHALGWQSAQAVEQASTQIANLLNGDPDEVIFTSGATEANNLAVLGAAQKGVSGARKRIVISAIEHKCVIEAAQKACTQFGFTVDEAPVGTDGRLDIDWMKNNLDESVLLVSVIAVNNEIGTIQDLPEVARLAHGIGAFVHSDCAQAPVAMDLRMIADHVDMASLSAHKMYGPKGIGALWISRSIQDHVQPILYGGGQQQGLRSGTVPVPLAVGMGEAARILLETDMNRERLHSRALIRQLVNGLQEQGINIALNSLLDETGHPASVSVQFIGMQAQDILQTVQPHLAASTGSACTSGIPEPSHVLRAIGLTEEEAQSSIRFGIGRDTVEEDIDQAVGILANGVRKFSKIV